MQNYLKECSEKKAKNLCWYDDHGSGHCGHYQHHHDNVYHHHDSDDNHNADNDNTEKDFIDIFL